MVDSTVFTYRTATGGSFTHPCDVNRIVVVNEESAKLVSHRFKHDVRNTDVPMDVSLRIYILDN